MADGNFTKTVNVTLDGERVPVPEGTTIWEAAHGRGLRIPHLCHSPEPGYRPDGNCRVCMVDIEGERVLVGLLHPPSRPRAWWFSVGCGARRKRSAEMVMELLLADQPPPESRPRRRPAQLLGLPAETMELSKRAASRRWQSGGDRCSTSATYRNARSTSTPAFIARRCVRACREVQVNDVIGMAGRGARNKYPVFDFDDPDGRKHLRRLRRMRSGLPHRRADARFRPRRAQVGDRRTHGQVQVDSVCPYCGVGCQLTFNVKDNKIRHGWTAGDGPANHGRLCVKGRFGFDYVEPSGTGLTSAADPPGRRAGESGYRHRPGESLEHALPRGHLGRSA